MSSIEMLDEKKIKKAIADSLSEVSETLGEAYVAQQKPYTQSTEFSSQKTKDTHTQIYKSYISSLNEVSAKIDGVARNAVGDKGDAYRSLKIDEAYLLNAVYMHELFFSNCFDPHSELFMDTLSYIRLQRDWGTFEAWQADFMACAQANREGWAICGYSTFLKRFVNTFTDGHDSHVILGLVPVIVLDTHAHAYFKDYLDDRKSYIVAMMKEFNWEVIEGRMKAVEKLSGVMR